MDKLNPHYVAGLFDGEGWFGINRGRRKDIRREFSYQVRAGLGMREGWIVRQLQEQYGGSIRVVAPSRPEHASSTSWNVTGEEAYGFAMEVGPLLKAKANHAMVVVAFQSYKRENINQPVSDERYERYGALYSLMCDLNQRGVEKDPTEYARAMRELIKPHVPWTIQALEEIENG